MEKMVSLEQAIAWAQDAAEIGRNLSRASATGFITDEGIKSLPDHIHSLIMKQVREGLVKLG